MEPADVFRTGRYLLAYIIGSVLFGLMFSVGLVFCHPGDLGGAHLRFLHLDNRQPQRRRHRSIGTELRANQGPQVGPPRVLCVLFLLNILGLIVFIVGVIVTAAISLLATAYVYRRLEGESVDVPTLGPAEA